MNLSDLSYYWKIILLKTIWHSTILCKFAKQNLNSIFSDMNSLKDRCIRFDWAIKRLLRQKANFDVLEGFLTVFLNEKVEIMEILESEGNQLAADDKFNRVDIKAKNSKGEIIIVEVQNTSELY